VISILLGEGQQSENDSKNSEELHAKGGRKNRAHYFWRRYAAGDRLGRAGYLKGIADRKALDGVLRAGKRLGTRAFSQVGDRFARR